MVLGSLPGVGPSSAQRGREPHNLWQVLLAFHLALQVVLHDLVVGAFLVGVVALVNHQQGEICKGMMQGGDTHPCNGGCGLCAIK